MIRKFPARGALCAAVVTALTALPGAFAQTAESAPAASAKKEPVPTSTADVDEQELIVLSPFTIEAAEDKDSYRAKSTLAGTRVRTDLNDIPSAISVVTSQFLKDTGAKNSQDLLVYTTSNEVGGLQGNFSGVGGAQTYNENANLLRPSNNTRVRGLAAADNTRDYFLTDIPWDGFNVGRVDLQRGPNSILFGAGSPAGIINNSVNGAAFKNSNKYAVRLDQYNSMRHEVDFNYVVLPKELAVRFSAVDDKSKYEQRPAFSNDRRLFFALRFDPKFFEGGNTSIKANYETGKIMANRPRTLAPIDGITPWFEGGVSNGFANLNKLTLNPNTTWNQYGNNSAYPSNTYPWFREAFMGRLMSSNIASYYDASRSSPLYTQMPNLGTGNGINSSGAIDGTIGGIEFARPWAIATYNAYARMAIPGGQYYSNKSLRDPSIFDFYHKLIDGDNKREWQNWKAANFSLSQTFLNDRIGVEYSYFGQRYDDGQYAFLNGDQYIIGVDINTHRMDGSVNPNVGRAYVGNSGQYGNVKNFIDRDSQRFTVMGELRFDDFMEKSLVTRILGRHVFTGLSSQDRKRTDYRTFARWASEPGYAELTGNVSDITNGARQFDWIAYLSGDLRSRSSASGAGLNQVTAVINPRGYVNTRFFDSRWNAPSVNPSDPYTYTTYNSAGAPVSNTGTQADNPANYYGWRSASFRMLNAENPDDLESLWTSGTKSRNITDSKAFTWQGYMWDGNFVPVFGWRKDKVSAFNSQAPKGAYNVALQTYSADSDGNPARVEERNTRSWGFVLHMPKELAAKLPGNTRVSVFYNDSKNFSVDAPRGDVFGNQLPNPEGKTKDYGLVISTLNDRITLKINRYETQVKHATLQSDTAGFSSSLYYVWALPYWGATHALAALDGIATPQRRQGNWGWPWNGITNAAGNPATNAEIFAIARDFFNKFPLEQRFADEYGLGLNVSKMKSASEADWYLAVPTYGSGSIADGGNGASALGLQPAYNGNLKSFGSGPVADVDTLSKGYEIELSARPTNNWNLTLNASRTDAQRTALSTTIETWISTYTKFMAGDAGLIRLWGGDTLRTNWANNVLAPYSAIKAQMGSQAPEIPKWRANAISTYSFDHGVIKGFYVGGAYRWEDRRVLGYDYDEKKSQLDVSKPYRGPMDEHVDLWLGYSRKIGKRVDWNIQLNIRNVMEHTKQVPVTINPDGLVALTRIAEGQTWQVTNTFTF